MNFHVGQKVVCVRGSRNGRVKKGQIYTVSGHCYDLHWGPSPGLLLCEAKGADDDEFCRCFIPGRFRPIVERKTDISVLERLLVPGAKILETTP